MEQDKPITGSEGFEIINRMISTARREMDTNSFYLLLWGWLVLAASLGHFLLAKMHFAYPFAVWLLMPVGGVVTVIYAMKDERRKKVRSYVDQLMSYVLTAFLVSLVIVLSFIGMLQLHAYPMVMIIYAIWLFISGGALRFRPLIVGGVINWMCAIAAFFVSFDGQLLLLAFAVLAGYIVPGHMLSSRTANEKKSLA